MWRRVGVVHADVVVDDHGSFCAADMDVPTMMQLINTNVAGVMLSCREALLSMKKYQIKDGHIININR